jgi:hypothetical protein
MKLYKYRDLFGSTDTSLNRVFEALRSGTFWCASPDTLNDPTEFIWECDYEPSTMTASLLSKVLAREGGTAEQEVLDKARAVLVNRRLEAIAKPIFEDMIRRCRQEIGVACFATANDSEVMWKRYGGNGSGVCIEIDVPDRLLDDHLFRVEYPSRKVLTVDQLLAASLEMKQLAVVYRVALLSKPPCWAPEQEVRFVSRTQNVAVRILDSAISGVTFGRRLAAPVRRKIVSFIESMTS